MTVNCVGRQIDPVTTLLGHGVYSFSEVQRLTGVSSRRIRYWFLGDSRRKGPVEPRDYSAVLPDDSILSFLDLVDAMVVGKLREAGVSLQYLRKVYGALRSELGCSHPFSLSQDVLLTDGRQVFVHFADEFGEQQLREVLTRQNAFPEVLLDYMRRIDYDPMSALAERWNIANGIVVDPTRCFGKPIIDGAGVGTAVLAAAFDANAGDQDLVADWYGVAPEDVQLAVEFERHLDMKVA